MKLLIDIGNTRLKWALSQDGRLGEVGAVAHEGEPARVLTDLPAAAVAAVWIAQVTGESQAAALDAATQSRFGLRPQYARSAAQWRDLRNAYAEPARLGVDRWLTLIAAWSESRGACAIVNAGTALTGDGIDAEGRHLGGFIAAGLDAHQRAVLGATRFETRAQAPAYDAGFGRDTERCVQQGAMLACLGAADRAARLAGAGARRLLAGGDAGLLLPHLDGAWTLRPHLVLEGLQVLADDRSSPAADR